MPQTALVYILALKCEVAIWNVLASSLCLPMRVSNHSVTCLVSGLHVDYKILVLTYKALYGLTPQYLRSLLQWYQPGHTLRSGHSSLLCVPKTRLRTYGDRAFLHTAPILWNLLPPAAHWAPSLASFKTRIKKFLFDKSLHRILYMELISSDVCSTYEWARDMVPCKYLIVIFIMMMIQVKSQHHKSLALWQVSWAVIIFSVIE